MSKSRPTEVRLLTKSQVVGNKRIDLFKKIDRKCAATDFAILIGALSPQEKTFTEYDKSQRGRTVTWILETQNINNKSVDGISYIGKTIESGLWPNDRANYIRPVLFFPNKSVIDKLKTLSEYKGFRIVEYGEYPQYIVPHKLKNTLEVLYNEKSSDLVKTGKTYITDTYLRFESSESFKPKKHMEYEYNGNKYIRFAYSDPNAKVRLSDNYQYEKDDYAWIRVSPIKWFVDESIGNCLISMNCLAGGIRVCGGSTYDMPFESTEMYKYLNTHFIKNISQVKDTQQIEIESKEVEENPYGFSKQKISEEQIIKDCVECGVPVFLHGKSSDGKSARVKQIDPDCTILYLRNATPESLNGKCAYNQQTGEIIYIKPSWLKKLEEKCDKEKDKIHILFFDELTNALPSIQGMAFNIVLDKEVNGIWKLPDNARIVAAGNEMKDSLAANQLAEPLFNRFAHVYIETTVENWLKWARENHIHPAIYTYIAYKGEKILRSNYNGETPNADPRKWEMASNLLKATRKPKLLRAIVGEDIATDFTEFCNRKVITIEDVLSGEVNIDINKLETADRYATVLGLSIVNEDNLEIVRKFVGSLGKEYIPVFDTLWVQNDENRLLRIAELKIAEKQLIK